MITRTSCRYCGNQTWLVPSLRGGYRCSSFFVCLASREFGPRPNPHSLRRRPLQPDTELVIQRRCWEYFTQRIRLVPRDGVRRVGYRPAHSDRWVPAVFPFRSMRGAVDLPGGLSALDDLDYRRELIRVRQELVHTGLE